MPSLRSPRTLSIWRGAAAAGISLLLASSSLCLAQGGGENTPPPAAEPAAPASPAPEAKDVIARYVKAIGGESAVRAQKSRMMKGEMSMEGMGAAPLVIYFAAPNRMLVEVQVPDMGQFRQGFDGEVAWSLDPFSGPSILDDEQLAATRDQADFYGEVNFDKRFKSMESTGEKEFDGVKCYALKMVSNREEESTYFFEVESGLLRGTTQVQETGMGPMEMKSINKEYKEFGGVKFPVHTDIEMMGMVRSLKFTTIEIDTVKDEMFVLPDEIKALVEKGKAEEPADEGEPEKPEPGREN